MVARKSDHELILQLRPDRTYKEVAALVGCTHDTVGRVARSRPEHVIAHPARRSVPQEELDRAEKLLDDGAGYNQTALTTGLDFKTLKRHFPGRALSREESLDRAKWGQVFNVLSNTL
jgi:hypothetical protein